MTERRDHNRFKRIGSVGSLVVAGDFALSAGFGSTASVSVTAGSTDMAGKATVTSAGTGQGANPTCTLTFKDGAFPQAPFAVACRTGGSQLTVPVTVTTTTTTMVITIIGTPSAAETFGISWAVIDGPRPA